MCQLAEKDDRIALLEQQLESMEHQANELMAVRHVSTKLLADVSGRGPRPWTRKQLIPPPRPTR